MDRLSSLETFIKAAELGSFTDAGRQLGVTPSGIAKAISRLEERIGVRLFNRNTRSVSLTPEGQHLFEKSRRIFDELTVIEDELTQSITMPKGKLRVALPLSGIRMMPEITRFMQNFPDIELDLDFTDRLVDIVEESFDVAIRTGSVPDSTLMTRVLGSFGHKIVGTPEYFHKHGRALHPKDMMSYNCFHHKFPSTGRLSAWKLRDDGGSVDVQIPISATASTLESLLYMVRDGAGIAYLPTYMIHDLLNDRTLTSILDEFSPEVGVFRAVWPSTRMNSAKIRAFIEVMAAYFSSDNSFLVL